MFAILFEALLIEIQEEIPHFAGWVGGGVNGHKNCELNFCEQPKGPRRTKNSTCSKFTMRSIFSTAAVIYYLGAPSAETMFLGITDISPLKEGSTA